MPAGKSRWMQYGVVAAICSLVVGVYALTAHSGYLVSTSLNPADACYNLLVQSFRAGQLNLKKEVPPGLAQLADPYDPEARFPYRMLDMSYYRGKLYLYFGATPAVVLFWPYVALTGHYLLQKDAVVVFCSVGFLVGAGLLCALWRRYFAEVSVGVVAGGTLALGLVPFTPVLVARCDVHEVSISCGYALTMLALAAIWKALHEPAQRGWWLASASLAYGLAVGARPSLLFGAVILLVPVVQAWRERRKAWILLMAATGPLALIGLGLLLYNALRFDNPFEFGWRYQLAGDRQSTVQPFSLRYLWFNFRVYFLELARWSGRFPFVHDITTPPLPAGHGRVEHPFGVLTNVPLVWLALGVPLAWRGRSVGACSILCGFLVVVTTLFVICTLTMDLFFAACFRYEVEFLSTLVLLAIIGILSLERALAPVSESGQAPTSESGLACQPVWRHVARWGWGLLLGFSVAFNLLASVERYAEAHYDLGSALLEAGKVPEAIAHYEQALRLKPDYAEAHNNLAIALGVTGKIEEAIGHCEQAVRLKPDFAGAHYNLAVTLEQVGRVQEAIGHYEEALQIRPNYAEAHNDLGFVLNNQGQVAEAIAHYEQALRIKPDYAEAHNNLGSALARLGRVSEAIVHWEQALQINPDYAKAHYNLGSALEEAGRVPEAIGHYEQALRIKPDFAEAHNNLGLALKNQGKLAEAIAHYEQALHIRPDYAEAHYNFGVALEQMGRVQEAIGHYEQALCFKPDFAEAQNRLARLRAGQ